MEGGHERVLGTYRVRYDEEVSIRGSVSSSFSEVADNGSVGVEKVWQSN